MTVSATDWTVCPQPPPPPRPAQPRPTPYSYVEILTFQHDALRRWGLGRWPGHEGEAPRWDQSLLGTPGSSVTHSLPYEDTVRKQLCHQEGGSSPEAPPRWHPDLRLQPPELWERSCCFFSSLLACETWLEQLERSKTVLCRLQGPPCRGGQGILLRASPSSRSWASEWGRDPLSQWHGVLPHGLTGVAMSYAASPPPSWGCWKPVTGPRVASSRVWEHVYTLSSWGFPSFRMIHAMRTGWCGSSPLPGVAQITRSWAYQHRQSPGEQRNRSASDGGCIPQLWHWGPTCNALEYLE